jgi:DNA adenine methylase
MRPALRYHGGKWRIAPWILGFFPEHRIYVEPFGGAASVLLRKPRAYAEVYNDLDGEIVRFFRVLRDRGEELKRYLDLTAFARAEIIEAYNPTEDPLVRAARTVMKSFMGYGSDSIRRKSGFRADSQRSGTTPAHDWVNYPKKLPDLVERLQGIVIEQRPAVDVIQKNDTPETLFYVDPPYLHSVRSGISNQAYRHEMTDAEHKELATVLHEAQGKVVISGYPSDLYEELYSNWHREEKEARADGSRPRTEVLWMNFMPVKQAFEANAFAGDYKKAA